MQKHGKIISNASYTLIHNTYYLYNNYTGLILRFILMVFYIDRAYPQNKQLKLVLKQLKDKFWL